MDISLSDVFWVGGSLIAFVIVMSLAQYARPAAQTVVAIWRQACESGLIRINIVKDYEESGGVEEGQDGDEITSTSQQTRQTDETNKQTDRVFVGDQWLTRLKVDRTKSTLIELLVYSGWGVGEIRSAIKGDSTAIGLEIQALRGGGVEVVSEVDSDVHVTPIAGRVTQKKYYPDEPELEYHAP